MTRERGNAMCGMTGKPLTIIHQPSSKPLTKAITKSIFRSFYLGPIFRYTVTFSVTVSKSWRNCDNFCPYLLFLKSIAKSFGRFLLAASLNPMHI